MTHFTSPSKSNSHVIVDVAVIVGCVEKLVLAQSGAEPVVDVLQHLVVDRRRQSELVEELDPADAVEIALADSLRRRVWIQDHQHGEEPHLQPV